jgi:EpsI family protein
MAILFTVGARWREDGDDRRAVNAAGPALIVPAWPRARVQMALVAVLALTALWPMLELLRERNVTSSHRSPLSPIGVSDGWVPSAEPLSDWRPDIAGATAALSQTFEKDGARVGLLVEYFDGRTGEGKAITSTNQIVSPGNKQWLQVAQGAALAGTGSDEFTVGTAVVARDSRRFAVWHWYWVDGRVTSSTLIAKLYEVAALVRGHGTPAAWVIVYTLTEHDEAQVRARLDAFATAMNARIDTVLREAGMP